MRPAIDQLFKCAALVLLVAAPARADRGWWYAAVSGGPAQITVHDPEGGGGKDTRTGEGVGLAAWYGWSNTLHLGAELQLSSLRGAQMPSVQAPSLGGTPLSGALALDSTSATLGALARYRYDSGYLWAPYFLGSAGVEARRGYNMLVTTGQGGAATPTVLQLTPAGRAELGVEYRLGRFVVGLGVSAFASTRAAGFLVPLTLAWIPRV